MEVDDIKLIKSIHKQLKETEALLKAQEICTMELSQECQHLRHMLKVAVDGLTEYPHLNAKSIQELNQMSAELRH